VAIRILPGMTSNRKEPGYYWRSVLFYVRDMLEEAEGLAAYARTAAKFNSFPNMKAWLHREEDSEGAESVVDRHFTGDVVVLNLLEVPAGTAVKRVDVVVRLKNREA